MELANDFTAYEEAELTRTRSWTRAVKRSLLRTVGAPPCASDVLLNEYPHGASILAPSGYGKTTLSFALHRQALSLRRRDTHAQLSFHFSLSDLENGGNIIGFLKDRLAAHCPWITETALVALLREHGAVLICDAFDRLTEAHRVTAELHLRNIIRDYPKVQIFVFSRGSSAPRLSLDVLTLTPLDEEQMREVVALLVPQENHLLNAMPRLLRDLCTHPLLLARTIEYWLLQHRFPTRIDSCSALGWTILSNLKLEVSRMPFDARRRYQPWRPLLWTRTSAGQRHSTF